MNAFHHNSPFKHRFILVVLTTLTAGALIFSIANAGTLTPSGAPTATSYTFGDIYTRLTTNVAAGTHTLSTVASPAATFYTLEDIYNAIPTIDPTKITSGTAYLGITGTLSAATGNATVDRVLAGYTFSNAGAADVAGTMTNNGAVTINPSSSDRTIPEGYHNGSGYVVGDTDLVAANIASGTNIFGVVGRALRAVGTAVASQVLSGYTFSNSSASNASGSMTNRGAVTITPSTTDQTIPAGYHNGSGIVSGDTDLVAANIVTGTNIFGIRGTFINAFGNATASLVLTGFTFGNSTTANVVGSMTNNGAVTITASTSNQTIAAGYHNGSGTVPGDADLLAINIVTGTNIFGVTGTALVSAGTAQAAQVLTGFTFSNATTTNISGTMTNRGAVTITPSTTDQTIPAGYHNGSGIVSGDADLVAANIVTGTNIFGVTGTFLGNLFGATGQGLTGGTADAGGIDDYNNASSPATGRYFGSLTRCVSGNSWCGLGSAASTSADIKDLTTNLIWSLPCSGSGCSQFSSAQSLSYSWDNSAVNNASSTAQQLCMSGAHGQSGWRLPHLRELMQAYIDGSYGNLAATGTTEIEWSATTNSTNSTTAYRINLSTGTTNTAAKSGPQLVRCVRSAT